MSSPAISLQLSQKVRPFKHRLNVKPSWLNCNMNTLGCGNVNMNVIRFLGAILAASKVLIMICDGQMVKESFIFLYLFYAGVQLCLAFVIVLLLCCFLQMMLSCWLHQAKTFSVFWGGLLSEAAGMRFSTSKAEAMIVKQKKKVSCPLQIEAETYPKWMSFSMLGSCSRVRDGWMEHEIDRRSSSNPVDVRV